jgi:hypothetical protein
VTDLIAERIRAHRGNIHRYRRVLATPLTETERQYIHRRIGEERSELERLVAHAEPELSIGNCDAPSTPLRGVGLQLD